MKKILLIILFGMTSMSTYAKQQYGWGNVHFDYQSWDSGFKDLEYEQALIGVEGGVGFDWGEMYGFYDYENILDKEGNQGQTMNGESHVYLGESGFSLFGKVYNSQSPNFKETNQFLGLGYTALKGDGWWFKPWIGRQYITAHNNFGPAHDINGLNGFSIGWNAGYAFKLLKQDFLLSNWNEIELDRNDDYASNNFGHEGLNGGLNLTMKLTDNISTTFMYRYFYNKLGADGYGDILIYRIAYDF
ncbi:TPA: outer membrane protein OmpK [Klebsiella pneumoniae]